jgi:hypothetical protein
MNKPHDFTANINVNLRVDLSPLIVEHTQQDTDTKAILRDIVAGVSKLLRGQKGIGTSMSRLTDAVENLKTITTEKLNEAIRLIRDPDEDSEQAAVILEEFAQHVQNLDLTTDEEPTP